MTQPYPRAFTYEETVAHMAKAIGDDFADDYMLRPRNLAISSAAFAMSLAYNRAVAEVAADIKSAIKP
jgi:hypothetical protein